MVVGDVVSSCACSKGASAHSRMICTFACAVTGIPALAGWLAESAEADAEPPRAAELSDQLKYLNR